MKAQFDILLLRAAIEAVMPAASDDDERPGLCSIQLSVPAAGEATTIATDGTWVAQYALPPTAVDEAGQVAISTWRASKLLALLEGEVGTCLVVTDGSLCRFEIERVGRLDCVPVEGFPALDKVWPTEAGERISKVGMSPRLLTKIGKAFHAKKGFGLCFEFYGEDKAILITAESLQEMKALLMPMRVEPVRREPIISKQQDMGF